MKGSGTKDDVKIPEGDLGRSIRSRFVDEEKDVSGIKLVCFSDSIVANWSLTLTGYFDFDLCYGRGAGH